MEVKVRRVCDKVMTIVVFEKDVLRLNCVYALLSGRRLGEKSSFHD